MYWSYWIRFLAKSYCAIRFWHACHNNYTVLHGTNVLLKFVVILIYGLICRFLKGGDLMNTCIFLPVYLALICTKKIYQFCHGKIMAMAGV